MNQFPRHAAFAAGLAVVAWVGAGYLLTNPLALVITVLIGALYLAGVLELHRFGGATTELGTAVDEIPESLTGLRAFLDRVPASLQNSVRRRIEGEPVGLPGPSLAPTLAGLLVLLGMLGTFLGMVLTLRGTGLALESAADLAAVRNTLAAPVRGLGVAFGTSIAGVATSAALGLLSALCRRERARVAQALDARIAGPLRAFSPARQALAQRDESLQLMRAQADLLPAVLARMQDLMAAMAHQQADANDRLLASQERFQARADAAYSELAASVDRSLRTSLADSARVAADTIRPVAEATLAGIARETASLQAALADTSRQQGQDLAARFEQAAAHAAQAWQAAGERHAADGAASSAALRDALAGFAASFDARAASLADGLATRQADAEAALAATLEALAGRTAALHAQLADTTRSQLEAVAGSTRAQLEAVAGATRTQLEVVAGTTHSQLDAVAARLEAGTRQATAAWQDALARHDAGATAWAADTRQALQAATTTFAEHAGALLQRVDEAQAARDTSAQAREQQRLAAWTQSLAGMAEALRHEWQQAGAQSLAGQQAICDAMAETSRDITTRAERHATRTIAEITALVQAASEAPRAAAEVIGELRDKLSDSMVRDNALLDERARLLGTLETLLDGVNRAATEQRGAIDALVATTTGVLADVGTRFGAQVDAQAARLDQVAAQVTGGAIEVASLGEAFGLAVQLFAQSNEQMVAQLQRIENALGQSLARSDEQLAYYVAQAREVIDLSTLSQKQVLEDLQRLAAKRTAELAS